MSDPLYPASRLDGNQVLKHAFNETTQRLRTDAEATIVNADIDVSLDSLEDSVAIGDSTTGDTLKINPDGSIDSNVITVVYSKRLDEIGATIYLGEAAVGSSESASTWRIQKITQIGTVLEILWANGNSNFNNTWDDRTTLSYS